MVSRRTFLRRAATLGAGAVAAVAVPTILRALLAVAAPPALTLAQQAEQYKAELDALGVYLKLMPGDGAKIVLHARMDGRAITVFPAEEWGTEDSNELLRQSVEAHRGTDEAWAAGRQRLLDGLARRSA